MFTVKYKPKNLKEFVDQVEALDKFLNWIRKWKRGKALLFYGKPGTGKTALLGAYANEKNLDLIEMNASDFRAASQIDDVLGRSVLQAPLFKKGKIFLIDEIDGLAGREDLGGVGAIIEIIKISRYPIILTANNPFDPKLRSLRQYCQLVPFKKIYVWDIVKRLGYICEKEGIKADSNVLRQIASRSEGDLRSAISDLESVSQGKKEILESDLDALGYREREISIFDVLKIVFKTQTALAAKLAINNIGMDPDEIFWWIENNVANEYEESEEIAKAFDALSLADLFRQKGSSRRNWRMNAYMIDLMTAGVAVAKREMYRKFTRYQYPQKIITLGRTKGVRADTKKIMLLLSKQLHCSTRKIRLNFLPFIKIALKDESFQKQVSSSLGLTAEDLSLLA